jgi:hypothetical protein
MLTPFALVQRISVHADINSGVSISRLLLDLADEIRNGVPCPFTDLRVAVLSPLTHSIS